MNMEFSVQTSFLPIIYASLVADFNKSSNVAASALKTFEKYVYAVDCDVVIQNHSNTFLNFDVIDSNAGT